MIRGLKAGQQNLPKSLLQGVTLSVSRGEVMGLVGASGSGKSLLALAVLGLLPEEIQLEGSIQYDGMELIGRSDEELRTLRGRHIGIVFQEPMTALNPLMQVIDQVAETVTLHRPVSRVAARAAARVALTSVGLSADRGEQQRYPHELSGGQRQRVAIAMAIILEPRLLIADEPTTALDIHTQAQVLRLLLNLARGRGMALLLISHDMTLITRLTDGVAVMHNGEIVEAGPTRHLPNKFSHPYAKALHEASLPTPLRPPRAATSRVLEVRNVVHDYRVRQQSVSYKPPTMRAVDAVSLHVDAGETVGLVGESGSGKSTLLRIVLALDALQEGDVVLNGESLSQARGAALRRMRRSIQVVFQDPYGSFDPQWSVEALVAEPCNLLDVKLTKAERRAKVVAALEEVGLSASDLLKRPHEFSGGQRQRLAIARAIIIRPAVIAFDEAVSALDVIVRAQVLRLLADLAQRLSLAYLFVSHDLNVVRAIADRVYVMQRGRIVEEGPTRDVFDAPQHEYTRAMVRESVGAAASLE